ncbi:hypothetical protein ATOBIA_N03310 [Atopobiaceae bacterium P1]|nr:hypothetical protein ATOBIA_N03310 [Atopobiaceae bacterium P1]
MREEPWRATFSFANRAWAHVGLHACRRYRKRTQGIQDKATKQAQEQQTYTASEPKCKNWECRVPRGSGLLPEAPPQTQLRRLRTMRTAG